MTNVMLGLKLAGSLDKIEINGAIEPAEPPINTLKSDIF